MQAEQASIPEEVMDEITDERLLQFLTRIFRKHQQANTVDSITKEFPEELPIARREGLVWIRELKPPKRSTGSSLFFVEFTGAGKDLFLRLNSKAQGRA